MRPEWMRTLRFQYVEALSLMVLVHGEEKPSDEDWDHYVGSLYREYNSGRLRRVLVYCDGPGPTPAQRKKLSHMVSKSDHPIQTAVVTKGVIARTIVTALSWFHEIRAFAPNELDKAFEHLTIPGIDRYLVQRVVVALRAQLATGSESPVVSA